MRLLSLLACCTSLASAATVTADLGGGRTLTVHAEPTDTTPLPPTARLALLDAGDACAPPPLAARLAQGTFAVMARRGECSFDIKMRTASDIGAAALLIGDTVLGQYSPVAANATAQTLALGNPCAVSCELGRGRVDAAALSLSDAFTGLPDQCQAISRASYFAGGACTTGLCALTGHGHGGDGALTLGMVGPGAEGSLAAGAATVAAPGGKPSGREVCCLLDTPPIQMAFPESLANGTALPALYLTLSHGQALSRACADEAHATATSASSAPPKCSIRIRSSESSDDGSGADGGADSGADGDGDGSHARPTRGGARWDPSAGAIFTIGVVSAALSAYFGAAVHHRCERGRAHATRTHRGIGHRRCQRAALHGLGRAGGPLSLRGRHPPTGTACMAGPHA